MNIRFVTADVAIANSSQSLVLKIETDLRQWGEPLRWAITHVDLAQQTVHVEAVVTTSA